MKIVLAILVALSLHAEEIEIEGWDLFDWMEVALKGEWVLSPAEVHTESESYK